MKMRDLIEQLESAQSLDEWDARSLWGGARGPFKVEKWLVKPRKESAKRSALVSLAERFRDAEGVYKLVQFKDGGSGIALTIYDDDADMKKAMRLAKSAGVGLALLGKRDMYADVAFGVYGDLIESSSAMLESKTVKIQGFIPNEGINVDGKDFARIADAVDYVDKVLGRHPNAIVLGPEYSLGPNQTAYPYEEPPYVLKSRRNRDIDFGYSSRSLFNKHWDRIMGWGKYMKSAKR